MIFYMCSIVIVAILTYFFVTTKTYEKAEVKIKEFVAPAPLVPKYKAEEDQQEVEFYSAKITLILKNENP